MHYKEQCGSYWQSRSSATNPDLCIISDPGNVCSNNVRHKNKMYSLFLFSKFGVCFKSIVLVFWFLSDADCADLFLIC
jgi:hypothetical protein